MQNMESEITKSESNRVTEWVAGWNGKGLSDLALIIENSPRLEGGRYGAVEGGESLGYTQQEIAGVLRRWEVMLQTPGAMHKTNRETTLWELATLDALRTMAGKTYEPLSAALNERITTLRQKAKDNHWHQLSPMSTPVKTDASISRTSTPYIRAQMRMAQSVQKTKEVLSSVGSFAYAVFKRPHLALPAFALTACSLFGTSRPNNGSPDLNKPVAVDIDWTGVEWKTFGQQTRELVSMDGRSEMLSGINIQTIQNADGSEKLQIAATKQTYQFETWSIKDRVTGKKLDEKAVVLRVFSSPEEGGGLITELLLSNSSKASDGRVIISLMDRDGVVVKDTIVVDGNLVGIDFGHISGDDDIAWLQPQLGEDPPPTKPPVESNVAMKYVSLVTSFTSTPEPQSGNGTPPPTPDLLGTSLPTQDVVSPIVNEPEHIPSIEDLAEFDYATSWGTPISYGEYLNLIDAPPIQEIVVDDSIVPLTLVNARTIGGSKSVEIHGLAGVNLFFQQAVAVEGPTGAPYHIFVWKVIVVDGDGHNVLRTLATSFDLLGTINADQIIKLRQEQIRGMANASGIHMRVLTQDTASVAVGDEFIDGLLAQTDSRVAFQNGKIKDDAAEDFMLVQDVIFFWMDSE